MENVKLNCKLCNTTFECLIGYGFGNCPSCGKEVIVNSIIATRELIDKNRKSNEGSKSKIEISMEHYFFLQRKIEDFFEEKKSFDISESDWSKKYYQKFHDEAMKVIYNNK